MQKTVLQFEEKVADFIEANGLFSSGDRVLLAVSGGADSIALLHVMQSLKAKNVLDSELLCAHIHHQLRVSEADSDEDFVVAETSRLKLPVTTKRLDVCGFARANRLSVETAGRKLRIENLLEIAKAKNCRQVATGHQKNDNAETVLHRLLRGTAFRGLGGIWPARAFDDEIQFVRPLLCVTRNEIVEYLQKRSLQWRTDRTNADCAYRRNYIRHRLLPVLQQDCAGAIADHLSELAYSARRLHSLVCRRVEDVWSVRADFVGDKVVLNLEGFLAESPLIKVELVRRSLTRLGSGERDLTHQHYEKILQIAEQNVSGRKIQLPGGFVVWREYENLIFEHCQELPASARQISQSANLEVPGRTRFGSYRIEAAILETEEGDLEQSKTHKSQFVEWFDLNKLELPLVTRFREAGDRFWPLGSAGAKKVGKFLTAAQVPQHIRRKILIVADRKKTIWVWPVRISEQARITGGTRKILQLQITGPNLQC